MSMALRYRGVGRTLPQIESKPVKYYINCRWKIVVDEPTVNLHILSGRVEFYKLMQDCHQVREFNSLRIQLEGRARTKFQSKLDNRIACQSQEYKFLPTNQEELDESNSSPFVFHFIRDGNPIHPQFCSVGSEKHIFPFEMNLTSCIENNFPASFTSPFGSIDYKLSVYVGSFLCEDKCVDHLYILKQGYFNLSSNLTLNKPLMASSRTGTSFFSRKPKLVATLTLTQKGYLSGETIAFRLQVDNPNFDKIQKCHVLFVQQIIYYASHFCKQTAVALDEKQVLYVNTNESQVSWEELLQIPDKLMPTFWKEKKCITCAYYVQFVVTVDRRAPLKGQASIVIGTTRDGHNPLRVVNEQEDDWIQRQIMAEPVAGPSRRQSFNSSLSSNSGSLLGYQLNRPPPAYSSVTSMDALPPAYEDAMESWDAEQDLEPRPRCHSNIM